MRGQSTGCGVSAAIRLLCEPLLSPPLYPTRGSCYMYFFPLKESGSALSVPTNSFFFCEAKEQESLPNTLLS